MGMLTRPKLMLPFQIARAIQVFRTARGNCVLRLSCGAKSRHLSIQSTQAQRYPEIPRLRCAPLGMTTTGFADQRSLRSQLELLSRDAAQLKKANQRFFDQIIRARRAGGDTDDGRSVRQPKVRNDFAFLM